MSDDTREGRAMGETVAGSIFCHAVVQGRDITVRLSPRTPQALSELLARPLL